MRRPLLMLVAVSAVMICPWLEASEPAAQIVVEEGSLPDVAPSEVDVVLTAYSDPMLPRPLPRPPLPDQVDSAYDIADSGMQNPFVNEVASGPQPPDVVGEACVESSATCGCDARQTCCRGF